MVLHLSVKKGLTVFQNFLLSVISFVFRVSKNVFLVDFSILEQISLCRLWDLFLLNVFRSLEHFMTALRSVLLIKTHHYIEFFSFWVERAHSEKPEKCQNIFQNYQALYTLPLRIISFKYLGKARLFWSSLRQASPTSDMFYQLTFLTDPDLLTILVFHLEILSSLWTASVLVLVHLRLWLLAKMG